MQMDINKGLLVVVNSRDEESSPEAGGCLPAESQRAALLCRYAVQL
jgi:hypothetical protein